MKKILGIIVAILASVVGIIMYMSSSKIEVEYYEVTGKENVQKYIEETANIDAKISQNIVAKTTGTILNIYYNEGDIVTKGTILAEIEQPNIILQLEQLAANKTELEALYRETLKPTDAETIKNAKSSSQIAAINLERSEIELNNGKVLYENGAINKKELEILEDSYEISKNQYSIAQNQLSLSQKKVSKDLGIQIKSKIEALEKSIQILENTTKDYIVLATVDGIVTESNYKKSDYITLGTKLFEIADISEYILKTEVLASDMTEIDIGSKVVIEDLDLGIKANGKVSFIAPKAFSKISDLGIEQKRVKIDIKPDENIETFKMNYEVDIKIIIADKENIMAIPNNAIFTDNEKIYVFKIQNDIAVVSEVKKGIEGEAFTEILEGVVVGDRIIQSPDSKLKNGAKIKVK